MFLNYLKGVVAKKIVKKRLSDSYAAQTVDKIRIIGILTDEVFADKLPQLISELTRYGIEQANIRSLVLVSKATADVGFPAYSIKDLNWNGTLDSENSQPILSPHLDLLINYYVDEKASLIAASETSKARFKVGFASVDKRLNHLIIDSPIENPSLFVSELFRYLKILNRI
ncbi:DUF6913 domain-containing protein [Flavobacterium silvaticum]|uniref:Uncharacterized protein n=1 Tax=Flavobacterium silvaticum TaxID=1852020 RepID=A0A972FN74_9FLAO|nr:hypothetical protein [Flavobacterium silvaticum]NMH29131.1 hypothetical protein [Flavobacterium silvaticum]